MNDPANYIKIYNTPVELGLRSMIILHTSNNKLMDLEKIMYLDYLCLNTADINGPESIHAPTPNRGVQVFAKKALIQKGLSIMLSKELIQLTVSPDGFYYSITEAGIAFLQLFQTQYFTVLVERCRWVLERWGNESNHDIRAFIDINIQKWGGEFLSVTNSNNL